MAKNRKNFQIYFFSSYNSRFLIRRRNQNRREMAERKKQETHRLLGSAEVRSLPSTYHKIMWLKENGGVSFNQAIKELRTSPGSFYRAWTTEKEGRELRKRGKPRHLTIVGEKELANWVRYRTQLHHPPSIYELRESVSNFPFINMIFFFFLITNL